MNRTFGLGDLERSGRGAKTRYSARLTDEKGIERYELVVAGAPELIKRAFSDEATLEVEVDPTSDKKVWTEQLGSAWRAERAGQAAVAELADVPALFKTKKPRPPAPTAAKSAFVSLRQLESGGTRYFIRFSGFAVPVGMSLFFFLPPVCSTFGTVVPASGDQDLFLHLAWPPLGPVRASVRGGTAVDAITFSTFCTLFTQFGPIWHLFGFSTGVCGTFTFGGTDVFG
jgi:hypothetical protein